jgi:hypothetical protein
MTTEFKKLLAFGIIISLLTSTYVTFLGAVLKQGLFSEHFFINWFSQIPKTYLFVLPFVLTTGPLVRKAIDFVFLKYKI